MGLADLLNLRMSGDEGHVLPFASRRSAGAQLGRHLAGIAGLANRDVLVLGIPRGGVSVAVEVADALGAELDVAVARKLGAPRQPELAIGAVTADGATYVNWHLAEQVGVTSEYLEAVTRREQAEARRRERRFRGDRPSPAVAGRIVILVDDGLATGATMFAAVDAVKKQGPARLVVAVPVGSRDACDDVARMVDDVVCLARPEPFYGVGVHYLSFPQVEDDEVSDLLAAARTRRAPASGG